MTSVHSSISDNQLQPNPQHLAHNPSFNTESDDKPTSSLKPPTRVSSPVCEKNLRVLIVDDNFINLRTLSTLLNRRFSPFLDHPPVAVDSGLKAIQQLRSRVFDVILMDIQMPFLSGLECTKRIRAGEDSILSANRLAHIVAVTTCNGAEASSTYRQTGFSGLIPKPVRFQAMSDYLIPLSKEAFLSKVDVEMISPMEDGTFTYPPLPPSFLDDERAFFDFSTSTVSTVPTTSHQRASTLEEELLGIKSGQSSAASISNSENFAILLAAQTRATLKKAGAVSIARTGTVSGSSTFFANVSRRKPRDAGSFGETSSLASFDRTVFADQVAQEMEAAKMYDSDDVFSDSNHSVKFKDEIDERSTLTTPSQKKTRPPCHHRFSSPAFMEDSSPDESGFSSDSSLDSDHQVPVIKLKVEVKSRSEDRLQSEHQLSSLTAVRPSIRPLGIISPLDPRNQSSISILTTTSSRQSGDEGSIGDSGMWNVMKGLSFLGNSSDATTVDDGNPDQELCSSPLSDVSDVSEIHGAERGLDQVGAEKKGQDVVTSTI